MGVIGGDMLDAVRAMPDHLRDALWRIETARAATMEAPAAFVCGMGGSAIGGDLAIAALSDRLTKPMMVCRGYELPAWAPAGSAVLCSQLLGQHRGDARLLRGRRGPRRAAAGRHDRR